MQTMGLRLALPESVHAYAGVRYVLYLQLDPLALQLRTTGVSGTHWLSCLKS